MRSYSKFWSARKWFGSKCKKPTDRWAFLKFGAGTRSRTRDLLITSQLLYQLSYTGKEGGHYIYAVLGVNH